MSPAARVSSGPDAKTRKALENFREGLDKSYGDRVAPRLDDDQEPAAYEVISSGSLTLDKALGIGGFAVGRMHEIVGAEDGGKTTLMINAAAAAQRQYPDRAVGYVDIEKTFDDSWARRNGLSLGWQWDHIYADDSEDCSDLARKMCSSGLHSVVIVDSIGGMESRKALARDAVDELPGRNAQVITRMCKALSTYTRQYRCTVLLVNQLRAVIGGFGGDVSAGPKELKYATTTKVTMKRLGGEEDTVRMKIGPGGEPVPVSFRFRAGVSRSKVIPVGSRAEFWINNRETPELGPVGINRADEYVTLGVNYGVIRLNGSYYTIPGVAKPIQGRHAVARLLREDRALMESLRPMILSGSITTPASEERFDVRAD